MNFKKLQTMQAKLDEAILADKAPITEEERFNKTLVALSVEIAEVANCAEHFKFWKDNKGEIDSERFGENHFLANDELVFTNYIEEKTGIQYEFEKAHHLTLIEECSDALHFILSLANQLKHEISNKFLEPSILYVVEEKPEKELLFLEILHYFAKLDRKQRVDTFESLLGTIFMYIISLGVTTEELEQAYYDKNKINYECLENDDFVLSVEEMEEQPQLNENQEIVLEWLKENYNETENPIETLGNFGEEVFYSGYWRTCIEERYWKLTKREQFEILQVFGRWGMETNK